MTTTVCSEGHDAVSGREDAYGEMGKSWQSIGERALLFSRTDDSEGEIAVKVLIAMKLERLKNSPENRDHYRDLCGYMEVLWQTSAWRRETAEEESELVEQWRKPYDAFHGTMPNLDKE